MKNKLILAIALTAIFAACDNNRDGDNEKGFRRDNDVESPAGTSTGGYENDVNEYDRDIYDNNAEPGSRGGYTTSGGTTTGVISDTSNVSPGSNHRTTSGSMDRGTTTGGSTQDEDMNKRSKKDHSGDHPF